MNVPTITMSKSEARRRLKPYRTSLHRRADAEYEAAAAAYRALAAGHTVLNLADAFATAPLDDKGRPRLCIARADQRQAWISAQPFSGTIVCATRSGWGRGARLQLGRITLSMPDVKQFPDGWSLVPLVPPEVKKHHALRTTCVLWEVETWAPRPIVAEPDRDPMLLRHLAGELWVVLGEWDLTDVERAIMGGRARI